MKMVVYSYSGVLHSSEKECTVATHNTTDGSQEHDIERKKPDREEYTFKIPFM